MKQTFNALCLNNNTKIYRFGEAEKCVFFSLKNSLHMCIPICLKV